MTTVAQILMVQIEPIGRFFRTCPLSLMQWVWITIATFTIIPVAWVGRWLCYKLGLE